MHPEPQQQHVMPSMQYWVGPPLPVPAGEPAPVGPAGVGRRALGWFVDSAVVAVAGVAVVGYAVRHVVEGLPEYVGGLAADTGVSRLVGLVTGHGDGDGGIRAALAGSWLDLVLPIIVAVLAVPVLQFAYQAVLVGWRGRTFGGMLADTKVAGAGVSQRFAVRRALAKTVTETGLVALGFAILLYGQLELGALTLVAAIVAWCVNVLPVFGPRHRTVVDRLAGTIVVRRAFYAQVAAQTAALARRSSGAAVVAGQRGAVVAAATGRRTSDAAVVAARMGADAAAVAAQLTAEATAAARQRSAEHMSAAARRTTDTAAAAARVAAAAATDAATVAGRAARQLGQTAPVQQVLNTKVGQQSQVLGAAGARQARVVGDRTAGLARKVGGRTQQAWRERRAARAQQEPPQQEPPQHGTPQHETPQYGTPQHDEVAPQAALPSTAPDLLSPAQYFPAEPAQYIPTEPQQWQQPGPRETA